MLDIINNNLDTIIAILGTVLTAIAGFIGSKAKSFINDKIKKEIIHSTVKYVEQIYSSLNGEEKLSKAKEKALEWLKEKGIKISNTELEILIESAVQEYCKKVK